MKRLFKSATLGLITTSRMQNFPSLHPLRASLSTLTHPSYDRLDEFVIEEYGMRGTLLKHRKSGAQVLSIAAPDDNKVFGINFRTPPTDSAGIAHVLEHSVLCGSRKYPVKKPFVELLKGSLKNFLNAMTYGDRTCYPVASTNLKDFYNLVNVYLDAVLHPRAVNDPQILQQEGWHYELEKPEDPLTIKGVVYNEMKGVYSSPESLMSRLTQQALFPHNAYGVDSGGDPAVIPDLTFEKIQDFHRNYYHPSNSHVFFYGDDDQLARLNLLDEYLKDFDAIEVDSAVQYQPKFTEPLARKVIRYPVNSVTQTTNMITVNWLLNDVQLSTAEMMALSVLERLLLGTSQSPLKKALTESNLGESVIGGGLRDHLLQSTFSVGMKGVKPENVEKVEQLVQDTLARLAREGFESDDVEAAMNTFEFRLREFNTGGYPKGLSVMLAMNEKWNYDRHPVEGIRFEESLTTLKKDIASAAPIFQNLILKYLLDNQHRISVQMVPDTQLEAQQNEAEAARLSEIKKSLTSEQIQEIIDVTARLKEAQQAVDSPEAKATIPSLALQDLDPLVTEIETVSVSVPVESGVDCQILTHPQQTNGILYAEVLLDYSHIDIEDLPLLPLFSRMLRESGTTRYDETQLTRRIGATTGGIAVSYHNDIRTAGAAVPNPDDLILKLVVEGKATTANIPVLFDLVGDILLNARLDNKKRAVEMLKERKARLESAILSDGRSFGSTRLSAKNSFLGFIGEMTGGITSVRAAEPLVQQAQEDWPSIQTRLERIRTAILGNRGVIVNLTGEQSILDAALPVVNQFLSALPADIASMRMSLVQQFKDAGSELIPKNNEAFTMATKVNYVVSGGALLAPGQSVSGVHSLITRYLSRTYLWDTVRVLGGAYGGSATFSKLTGRFAYMSYRDPNVLNTIQAYERAGQSLIDTKLTDEELLQSIIGAIGDLDAPMSPDQKGYKAMVRLLNGETTADRQRWRTETLQAKQSDFVHFGEQLLKLNERANVVVFGAQKTIDVANEALPESKQLVVTSAILSNGDKS